MAGDLKLTINDNDLYTLAVPEGDTLGVASMAIYYLTMQSACSLRYEGLAG